MYVLRHKLSFIIFGFNICFKMAASIGSHFEIIKLQYLKSKNPISMQFASNFSAFQILVDNFICIFVVLSL